jgi:hypothetical protein
MLNVESSVACFRSFAAALAVSLVLSALTPLLLTHTLSSLPSVCIKVIQGVMDMTPKKHAKNSLKIEGVISKYCAKKSLDYKEKKVCYLIDPIKRVVSRPLSIGMNAKDVCARKLRKKNPEICHVKYKIKTDANTDYSKMRVKHLKQILAERGATCRGCLEKADFVKKVKATAHLEL